MNHPTPIVIDITVPLDEAFWCTILDTQPALLRQAIQEVGCTLYDVIRRLEDGRTTGPVVSNLASQPAGR